MARKNPILGFGWIGWLAAAVLLLVAYLAVNGVDFVEYFYLHVGDVFGSHASWGFLLWFHIPHFIYWNQPLFGLISMGFAIIAIFISPLDSKWWRYLCVILLGLCMPLLMSRHSYIRSVLLPTIVKSGVDTYLQFVLCWMLLSVATTFAIYAIFRSRFILATMLAATVMVAAYMVWMWFRTPAGYVTFPSPGPLDAIMGMAWVSAVGAAMIGWARHARALDFASWQCQTCGYDLRGAPHERCPECGSPRVAGATTASVNRS